MASGPGSVNGCSDGEIADSRKRPLDGEVESGVPKRSHHGGGKIMCLTTKSFASYGRGLLIFRKWRNCFSSVVWCVYVCVCGAEQT